MRKLMVISIVVICLAGLHMINDAMANPARDTVSGTGLSTLVLSPPPEGVLMQFEGNIELSIRNGEPENVELLANVYSVVENEEGVQHVKCKKILTFEDGSTMNTDDMELAEPSDIPGVYLLNANLKVVSGTGVYEGASGNLTAHGTIDFTGLPSASFELRGTVSSPNDE